MHSHTLLKFLGHIFGLFSTLSCLVRHLCIFRHPNWLSNGLHMVKWWKNAPRALSWSKFINFWEKMNTWITAWLQVNPTIGSRQNSFIPSYPKKWTSFRCFRENISVCKTSIYAFLGSVSASISDFVRVCVRVCVNNQFLVKEMTTFNEWCH